MKFFLATQETYENARATLDAAWRLPNDKGTVTCIEPAATAPRDSQGRILLAVPESFCQFTVASDLLPQLLAAGMVEEIDEAGYHAAIIVAPE